MSKRVVIIGGGAALVFAAFIVFFAILGHYEKKVKVPKDSKIFIYAIDVVSYEIKGDSLIYRLNNPHKELDIYMGVYFTVKGKVRELNYEGHFERHIPNGLSNVTVDLSKFQFHGPDDGLTFSQRKEEIDWLHMDIVSEQFPGLFLNITNFVDGAITTSTKHDVIAVTPEYFKGTKIRAVLKEQ